MNKLATHLSLALALGAGALLAGCATSSPDVVKRGDAQRMAQVEDAIVLSVRPVTIDGSQSGLGGVVGGVVGAIGGSAGSGVDREANVLGLLAGVAGAAAVAAFALPFHLNIVVSIAAAVTLCMLAETPLNAARSKP